MKAVQKFKPTLAVYTVLSAVSAAVLLVACGGGGASGSSSSTETNGDTASTAITSFAAGTVTGFGSVYVDGTEVEDATAPIRVENSDGSYSNVALKLGQHIEMSRDASGAASSITVNAAIVGAVSNVAVSGALGDLMAAGQWVKVNTDATLGPVTAYGGGYTALTDIAAGDLIEVHGTLVLGSDAKTYVIQATRIEKQSAISAIRVMGKISNLDSAAKTFNINGVLINYTSATLAPSSTTLANDQVVTIWAKATAGSTNLTAARVRVLSGNKANTITSGSAQLGGVVSGYNASAGTLQIDGVTINVASAALKPTGAVIVNGAYITIQGVFGADGVLTASSVKVRVSDTTSATANVQIKGVISSYVDASSFMVRGLPVDASGIDLAAACPGVSLADGVYVELKAMQQAGTAVVKATQLSCKLSNKTGKHYDMRDLTGTVVASSVDGTAMTFTLTKADGSTQKVSWTTLTAWEGKLTAATLNATTASIKIEGYLDANGVLVAREIGLLGSDDNDKFNTANHHANNTSDSDTGGNNEWEQYNQKFRPKR